VITVRTKSVDGCPNEYRFNLGGIVAVDFEATAEHVKCKDENNGLIVLRNIKGDFAGLPFHITATLDGNVKHDETVSISSANNMFTIPNLYSGLYTVTIRQNNSCPQGMFKTMQIEVDEPNDFLTAIVGEVLESLPNPEKPSGSAEILDIRGGTMPYQVMLQGLDDMNKDDIRDFGPVTQNNATFKFDTIYKNLMPGKYEAIVKDAQGCTISMEFIVPSNTKVFIPNVFTPNADDVNDEFYIRNLPAEGTKLIVTNRWGNVVFKSDNYNEKTLWNGGSNPDGVYFYQLEVKSDENKGVYTGYVEIWRGAKDYK
jgi:gliding motility-associated-like protein